MRDGKLPKRQYTDEFKIEAIRLSDSVGGHEAARRLGIPSATLSNWSHFALAEQQQIPDMTAHQIVGEFAPVQPVWLPRMRRAKYGTRLKRRMPTL